MQIRLRNEVSEIKKINPQIYNDLLCFLDTLLLTVACHGKILTLIGGKKSGNLNKVLM